MPDVLRTLEKAVEAAVGAIKAQAKDVEDKSEIAQVLKAQKSFRLQEDKGTRPNVHYVGKYSPRA